MEAIMLAFAEWIRQLLIAGIQSNLEGLFVSLNDRVGSIAGQVGATPQGFNTDIYTMIQGLSNNVILPIAGMILAIVAAIELISMVTDRNNMHDVSTWMFFQWIFKTACAVIIVANTWTIVMGVFEVAQEVVGGIQQNTSIALELPSELFASLEDKLEAMDTAPLLGLWLQTLVIHLVAPIMSLCVFVIIYGRIIEIYLITSVAPIPMALMTSRSGGSVGQNYLKSLCALALQGVLIMICLAIYAVLVANIPYGDVSDISGAIWTALGYGVLLCFALFKTGSLAKSILAAH